MVGTKVVLRTRMSAADAHYAGELVEGAHIVTAWGDVATELAIRMFGDEGLFVGYSEVRYTAPVYAGDFMEYVGWIEKKGNTSITCHFEAYKYIQLPRDPECADSAADVIPEPIQCAYATGTVMVPKDCWRFEHADPEFTKVLEG